jgi:hypothetical protein
MPFQYTNRRGQVYLLQSKTRKSGAQSYSFTRKPTGTPVDSVPEGYEVYELPDNGQVFLRKIKPTEILPLEKQLTETALRRQAKLENFIVEVDGNEIVIWLADSGTGDTVERLSTDFGLGMWDSQGFRERLILNSRYSKMMRFVLIDASKRLFEAERWCFRGSIDGWYPLDYGKPLPAFLKKYVPHLGKESFFELM